jgi:hypothetical protein
MPTFTHSIGPDVRIQFSEKPEERVRACLKAHGFRWLPQGGFWWRRRVTGAADVLDALRRLIGPRKPDGACWHCQSPEGYFRNHGAATPVHCERCHAELVAPAADRSDRDYEDACRDACGLGGGW